MIYAAPYAANYPNDNYGKFLGQFFPNPDKLLFTPNIGMLYEPNITLPKTLKLTLTLKMDWAPNGKDSLPVPSIFRGFGPGC